MRTENHEDGLLAEPSRLHHAPTTREALQSLGPWVVRVHAPTHPLFEQRLLEADPHVQLWHPESRTSVLLPCLDTGYLYSVRTGSGLTATFCCHDSLATWLRLAARVAPPDVGTLANLRVSHFLKSSLAAPLRVEVAA